MKFWFWCEDTQIIKWIQILKEENTRILKEKRTQKLSTLKEQTDLLKQLENEILETGLKTSTLKAQNDKFIRAINDYEVEYAALDRQKLEINQGHEQLQNEYDNLQRQFNLIRF